MFSTPSSLLKRSRPFYIEKKHILRRKKKPFVHMIYLIVLRNFNCSWFNSHFSPKGFVFNLQGGGVLDEWFLNGCRNISLVQGRKFSKKKQTNKKKPKTKKNGGEGPVLSLWVFLFFFFPFLFLIGWRNIGLVAGLKFSCFLLLSKFQLLKFNRDFDSKIAIQTSKWKRSKKRKER